MDLIPQVERLEYVEFGGTEDFLMPNSSICCFKSQNNPLICFGHKIMKLNKGSRDPIHLPNYPMIICSWEVKNTYGTWLRGNGMLPEGDTYINNLLS